MKASLTNSDELPGFWPWPAAGASAPAYQLEDVGLVPVSKVLPYSNGTHRRVANTMRL